VLPLSDQFLSDQFANYWSLSEPEVDDECQELEIDFGSEDVEMVELNEPVLLTIFDLPEEILTYIFRFLDTRSFSRAAGVCKLWRRLAASPWLWWVRSNAVWDQMLCILSKNIYICDDIISKQHMLKRKFSARVKLLQETLNELADRVKNRLANRIQAHYNVDCYYHTSNVLLALLRESNGIITRINDNPSTITVNFDMLDLSIRRYMHQLEYMFPTGNTLLSTDNSCFCAPVSIEAASSIIKDASARYAWEKYVGPSVHSVDFSWFYENVLLRSFPRFANDDIFRDFFSFFVNFPRDNMMTTYKWAVIIDQFGPFDEFPDNFRKYGCGHGFLGLINCVEAEEHLSDPNMFLIRFSRKEPEKLTFSFKMTSDNTLVCRHKRKSCGIPIKEFIAQHFNPRKFCPVHKRLEENITHFSSVEQYCESSGYFISNTP